MKGLTLKVVAGLLALTVIANPVLLNAQEKVNVQEVCTKAQMDAKTDVNGTLWMGAGFLFGLFGIGAAYLIEPDPPASRLLGKSPEYVAAYTDCYRDAARDIQVKKATVGCVIGTLLYIGFYGCLWGLAL